MKDLPQSPRCAEIREALRAACSPFGAEYWRRLEAERAYPEEFVQMLSLGGWLSAIIPQEWGGSGLGLTEASVILEEINRSGGNAAATRGQLSNISALLRHGTREQKDRWLPRLATGELRLQTLAVAEPEAGSDITSTRTTAVRRKRSAGDCWVVNGRKVWVSRVLHSEGMLLLARTRPLSEVANRTEGLSLFIVQVRASMGQGMEVRPTRTLAHHDANEVLFDNLEVEADQLLGQEGEGFRYVLDTLNAVRVLIAAECVGDAHWFIEKARHYANDRVVFGRPIGQNQGVQFPLAQAWMETEAADLMRFEACDRFDRKQSCSAQANMAHYLAAKASWEAADACLQTHGGFGFATEYDVERKFRETRVHQVAPISTNMILSFVGEHVLGMPRSF